MKSLLLLTFWVVYALCAAPWNYAPGVSTADRARLDQAYVDLGDLAGSAAQIADEVVTSPGGVYQAMYERYFPMSTPGLAGGNWYPERVRAVFKLFAQEQQVWPPAGAPGSQTINGPDWSLVTFEAISPNPLAPIGLTQIINGICHITLNRIGINCPLNSEGRTADVRNCATSKMDVLAGLILHELL
jgi:hypothetical protein